MAKVVLIWNEHPTEVVAGFHARKVAEILRKKYGHEVIVEKIPYPESNLGIMRGPHGPAETAEKLSLLPASHQIAADRAKKHKAPVFNFHASDADVLGNAKTRDPRRFRCGSPYDRRARKKVILSRGGIIWEPNEISIRAPRKKRHFTVEVPGHFELLPETSLDRPRLEAVRTELKKIAGATTDKTTQIIARDVAGATYYYYTMPLRHPKQQKYLHPAISEKIAAAIHERITGRSKR